MDYDHIKVRSVPERASTVQIGALTLENHEW